MNTIRRTLTLAAGLALVVALGGCGGDSGGPDCTANPAGPGCPPTPPPTPPPPITVAEGESALAFDELLRVPFETTRPGTLNGTVQWKSPSNGILVIVTNGVCTFDQLLAEQCALISTSLGTTPKPRRFSLSGRSAGPYTLFIGNIGPGDDSVSFRVELNATAAAAAAGAQATPAANPGTLDLKRFKRRVTLP